MAPLLVGLGALLTSAGAVINLVTEESLRIWDVVMLGLGAALLLTSLILLRKRPA